MGLFVFSAVVAGCGSGELTTFEGRAQPKEAPIAREDSLEAYRRQGLSGNYSIKGVDLKITVPPPSQEPYRLAVYLHGDTAHEHNEDGQPDGRGGRWNTLGPLKNFALAHHFVFVSARSPNRRSWWTDDGAHFADHSGELDAALESIIQRYGTLRDRFFFGGASGGSTFASAEFIPNFGRKYPGVYALMCGGAQRYRDLRELDRAEMRLFFNFGDRDFLYSIIRPAAALYQAHGIDARETVYRNVTHCGFDTQRAIASIWQAQL